MIEAAPGALTCPDCGHLVEDPRYVSFYSSGSVLFSDFYRLKTSMAVVRPQYVTCVACTHVNLLADFREARHPGTARIARWVESTWEQAFAALEQEQPPFGPASGYAHTLRLHLWRSENRLIAAGVPIADPQRRAQLLRTLVEECRSRSKLPIYQYLLGEIERQKGAFEVAAQRFRNLVAAENTDPLLVWHSTQNLRWCLEGRTLQQKLSAPPKAEPVSSVSEKRSRRYKLVVAVSDRDINQALDRWVNFPSGIMNISDLKFLSSAASVCDPLGGIVVLERDLTEAWPDASGVATFVESVSRITRALPWLLLGTQDETRTRIAALRGAGFHATAIDPKNLDRERFESWALHGQLRAEHEWRRVKKFS